MGKDNRFISNKGKQRHLVADLQEPFPTALFVCDFPENTHFFMRIVLLTLLSGLLMSASCGKDAKVTATAPGMPDAPAAPAAPIETNVPNAPYQPAFDGQTRAPGVKTQTPLDITIIYKGLNRPWGIVGLEDGRLLVTEKGGALRLVKPDGTASAPIAGLPAVDDRGQGGLLDVAADPDFAANRMLYWTFSERQSGGNLTAVAKGRLSADEKRIENAQVIYRATPAYNGTLHFGGRLLFDRSGNLFVSTGERSDLATRPKAQDITNALGKILYLTKDGQPARSGLFPNAHAALPAVYSYGHRNVQGLALHPQTGALWAGEFGPKGGDEINRIEAGKNYGWPIITYGLEYNGDKVGAGITQQQGLEQPVYYWDPSVSPSGMTFYSGKAIPEWTHNLFIGCLSGQHIVRLVLQNDRVAGEERLLAGEGERFRDVAEGRDGALYAITDGGKLYRLAPKG